MGLPKELELSAASSTALARSSAWPQKPAFEVLSGLEIIQQFFYLSVMSREEEKAGRVLEAGCGARGHVVCC